MKNESIRKVINVDKPNYAPLFEFKELDNAVIRLSLFKDSVEFDITGQTVKLGAKTSKGLKEQSEGFTINKNNLDIDLKNSILVPGAVEIDLELKDVSGAMTTASFFITVKSKVLNNKAVESTNEFDTFTKTVAKVEEDYKGLRRIIIDENQAANLQDQVNQTNAHLEHIDEFKEQYYKNNVDISLVDGYDKNDISKVLNTIKFEPNTRYFLNDGNLINRNLIQIDLPTGTKLEISGTITSYSSFMELRTSLKGSHIKLDRIIASEENKFDKGVHFIKGAMSKIDINVIKGFKNGLLLKPLNEPIGDDFNNSDWLQYNKIDFMEISGDIAISFVCTFKDTWINENTFNGGGLGGRINILMKKDFSEDEPVSIINNNKFYNLGVQSTEECIKIEEYSGEQNYFYNLRLQEQVYTKDGLDINDKGTQNYFETLWSMPIETIKLGKNSKYDGALYTRIWNSNLNEYPIVGLGAIGDKDLTKKMHIIKLDNAVSVRFIYNEYLLNACSPYIRCGMNDGEVSNIRIQEHLFFEGNVFMISKVGYSNSTVNLYTPNGQKLSLNDNGLYSIFLGTDKNYFEVHKISNTDVLTPN